MEKDEKKNRSLKKLFKKKDSSSEPSSPSSLYSKDGKPKLTVDELQEKLLELENRLKPCILGFQTQKKKLKQMRKKYVNLVIKKKRDVRDFPTIFLTMLIEDLEEDIVQKICEEQVTSENYIQMDVKDKLKGVGVLSTSNKIRQFGSFRSNTYVMIDGEEGEGEEKEKNQEKQIVSNNNNNNESPNNWSNEYDVREKCKKELAFRIFDLESGGEWSSRGVRGGKQLEEILQKEEEKKARRRLEKIQNGNQENNNFSDSDVSSIQSEVLNEDNENENKIKDQSLENNESDDESDDGERVYIVEANVMEYVDIHTNYEKLMFQRNQLFSKKARILEIIEEYKVKQKETSFSRPRDSSSFVQFSLEVDSSLGTFEIINGEAYFSPEIKEREPLLNEEWLTYFDVDGRVDEQKLKEKVFREGIDPTIRKEVWKMLLGYLPFNFTTQERIELRQQKREEYENSKKIWENIALEKNEQSPQYQSYLNFYRKIEKDVKRTDQAEEYFAGDDNPHLLEMKNILQTYAHQDPELGYVQGMSDLLSPIMMIMEDEADSYWCFIGYMKRMRNNFTKGQEGILQQISFLGVLLKKIDPELFHHFEKEHCANLFFTFRWILINFKREFDFSVVLELWEIFWTDFLTKDFHLYLALAILSTIRKQVLENSMQSDEILTFLQGCCRDYDIYELLCKAELLFVKYNQTTHVT